ncbi:hypothetical protein PHLH7_24870 [Pseudomonas sp. Ost2]|uniref:(2Fe-2S)-binding protein n=1 Tax=Pseudomonas sp. Ost2 TaxID=2678260 RepID=UPI001BEFF080|nr:(2Fe-2S)-binding protein [Pseudomonas sp. Ost2]BBP76383.1 hypothetical protein PHLH7_24870 [Pseudomonas sp. Ost2]
MKGIAITFEGTVYTARPGESLAATLIAGGVRHFRETRSGACRGLFCGMGVCQECLVDIDGRPNQRACMTKVVAPINVRRSIANMPLPLDVAQNVVIEPIPVRTPDVLVIGAGPGGLSAALAARQAGASVVVVDERSIAGGSITSRSASRGRTSRRPTASIDKAPG